MAGDAKKRDFQIPSKEETAAGKDTRPNAKERLVKSEDTDLDAGGQTEEKPEQTDESIRNTPAKKKSALPVAAFVVVGLLLLAGGIVGRIINTAKTY